MGNNLIENTTNVFWTVKIKDGLFVKKADFYNGIVQTTLTTKKEEDAERFVNSSVPVKVAAYVDGTIIKHTRTTVVTEVTEEVEVV